jgi:hypothetical protein
MKALWALIPAVAIAQEVPAILGSIPNRDNNKITFTTVQGECKPQDRLVYTQADGGKITATGCYRVVGDELFVVWESGDVYTYSLDTMTLSSEMQTYMRRAK